jgi:predicted dehydrogenase
MGEQMKKTGAKGTEARESLTRRDFVRLAAVSVPLAAGATRAAAQTGIRSAEPVPDKIRVGVIGCGGRGTGAAMNAVESSANVEIYAMGDLFQHRIDSSMKRLNENETVAPSVNVTPERVFVGFDAFQGVLGTDVEMVILATPPHFRPEHLRASVNAGKHIFTEKPVAVDPVGIRSVLESSDMADQKGLCVVAGTQRRHDPHYVETMKRIHDGAIGDIVAAQCYWNMGGLWVVEREEGWSDMEWQCRNWLYFTWLSGDHIVEQHVHNIDIVNWAMQSPPVKCLGMGGRQARTDPKYGNIYDHFAVEFEYPNGARVLSMCRQTEGASGRVSERLVGTQGISNPKGEIHAAEAWKYEGETPNPYIQEHADLIAAIRSGNHVNEMRRVAESTLCAIMGRMSAYTGREISWKWVLNSSQLDLRPENYEFGPHPVEPVAIPGKTELV